MKAFGSRRRPQSDRSRLRFHMYGAAATSAPLFRPSLPPGAMELIAVFSGTSLCQLFALNRDICGMLKTVTPTSICYRTIVWLENLFTSKSSPRELGVPARLLTRSLTESFSWCYLGRVSLLCRGCGECKKKSAARAAYPQFLRYAKGEDSFYRCLRCVLHRHLVRELCRDPGCLSWKPTLRWIVTHC